MGEQEFRIQSCLLLQVTCPHHRDEQHGLGENAAKMHKSAMQASEFERER